MSVPALSMASMAIAMAFAFVAPFALLIYYKKKGADVPPFFVGCGVFVLFALILETLLHQLVLRVLPVGEKILNSPWLYALYGGLAAGVFEETGRFLAFRTVLKKRLPNDKNALMYGAGHGGIECILLLGFAYVSNLVMAVLLNAGMAETLTAGLAGDRLTELQAVFATLTSAPPWTYLLGMVERCTALAIHISLSVLVWFAAKEPQKAFLYPLAILLHAAFDGAAVLLAAALPSYAMEACLAALALLLALLTRAVWKRNAETP